MKTYKIHYSDGTEGSIEADNMSVKDGVIILSRFGPPENILGAPDAIPYIPSIPFACFGASLVFLLREWDEGEGE